MLKPTKILLISLFCLFIFSPFFALAQEIYPVILNDGSQADFKYENGQWLTRITGLMDSWITIQAINPSYDWQGRLQNTDLALFISQLKTRSSDEDFGKRLISTQKSNMPAPTPAPEIQKLNDLKPNLKVAIGGTILQFDSLAPCSDNGEYWCVGWISQYIIAVYQYGVGLAAVLAVIVIMIGGFIYLTSGGSPDKVGKAKDLIIGAISGLALALFSYMILYTINPRLVALEPIKVKQISEVDLEGGVAATVSPGNFGGTVSSGTNQILANTPGAERLNGTQPETTNMAGTIVTNLAASGQLPQGFTITSGLRQTGGGQHPRGEAFDVSWAGINEQNADAFIAAARQAYPNAYILREVTSVEQTQYHATGPNIHIALPRQ